MGFLNASALQKPSEQGANSGALNVELLASFGIPDSAKHIIITERLEGPIVILNL